jgi:hypothetical protein
MSTLTITPADPWTTNGRKQRLVPDPETGEPVPYQRVSAFAKTLDTAGGLPDWLSWMALRGAAEEPDLMRQAVHAERTPAGIIKQLQEAGGSKVKAQKGTDRHTLVAMALTGATIDLPGQAAAELQSVVDLVRSLGTVVAVEAATVNDEARCAGSCDLILAGHDGTTLVCDLKTGRLDRLSAGIQLLTHARARYWTDGQRGDWVAPSAPRLVVIHAPQDGPAPTAIDIDPTAARAWYDLAISVRQARKDAA